MESKFSFIKSGDNITPVPSGINYTLKAGKVYELHNTQMDEPCLSEIDSFVFPEDYYLSDSDEKFMDKIVNTYRKTDKLTTGVLFSGLKGSGKTLMAKKTAEKSGLPVIVINGAVRSADIESFFSQVSDEVCIIMDELDKNWYLPQLLGFFDGVKQSCKKLILCTANEEKDIDKYMNDRCSRIRYKKVFDSIDKNVAKTILSKYFSTDEAADGAAEFCCSAMRVVSYDNVVVFGEEHQNNPDADFDDLLDDLNIARK
jgi:SpoVK/Ycf46/Vps4 family AAA+-type ATPase